MRARPHRRGTSTITRARPAIPLPDRDSPLYPWHRRPADHTEAGFFVHGPQPATSPLVRLMGTEREHENVPSPEQVKAAAKLTAARKRKRHAELVALVASIRARRAA